MNLMEDPTFKTKYHKYKIRVKLWESEFMEKFGRKPNKNDIKAADMSIREAYKMYWKLKTRALEETLTEITFCNDTLDVVPTDTFSELVKNSEKKQVKTKKTFYGSTSFNIENSYSSDYLPNMTASTTNITKKVIEGAWNQPLNLNQKYIKNDQTLLIRSSSFQLSQKMFKSLSFSKRNPRKSVSITKLNEPKIKLDTFSNHSKIYNSEITKDYEIQDILGSSFNDKLQIIYDEKKISDQPTIQQLLDRYTMYNKQLNQDWLNRCIGNDIFDSSSSEIHSLSENIDTEFKSFKNISIQNSFDNKSFTDDEDYICNSDSEEERKKKRIRNFDKIFNDCGLQPSKKFCITSDECYKKEIDNQFLKNTLTDINKIRFSSKFKNTLNQENSVYSVTNDFQNNTNSDTKIIKPLKLEQNTFRTMLKNSSYSTYKNKLQKFIKQQNFNKNDGINEKVIKDNVKNRVDKASMKNLESSNIIQYSPINRTASNDVKNFSYVLEPLNMDTNIVSMKQKSSKKTKYIEQSQNTGKFNENFIKINLKKKVFVRGKKSFNLSKYKRNQWKQRKKDFNSCETSFKLADPTAVNSKFSCFKCGSIGHFARYCKNLKNDLLLHNANTDISRYTTLNDIEEITKSNLVARINPTLSYGECQNIMTIQPETENCNKISDLKNSQKKTDILNSSIIKIESENFVKKLVPQIEETCSLYKLKADNTLTDTPMEVKVALKKFGHSEFREGQEKAIMRILSGQSTLLSLATGSGKSLCYQLPAYLYAKKTTCITLVISPLVSLMDDQIDRIPDFLQAACLHTNQSLKLQAKILENLKARQLDILLISPELLVSTDISSNLGKILSNLPPIAFVCIDEVHCISQWSHNFRPAYFTICKDLKEKLGVKIFLGLTATANKSTIMNIVDHLNIEDGMAGVILERPLPFNLNLTVSRDQHREEALIKLLHNERFIECDSIIIYCTRREECNKIAKMLRISLQDFKTKQFYPEYQISLVAEAYHAGLSAHRRKIIHTLFMKSKIRIIVATLAFGMGINKPNIRSVIHFNMPSNFESYVQEIGRAGRDGLPAYCHLFISSQENTDECELRRHINANGIDRHTIRRLLQKIFVPCSCKKLHTKLRCLGHEIVFSIDETVKTLDLTKEKITTLLCYLELHSKRFIKLLSPMYINAKICSHKGPSILQLAMQSSKTLTQALAFLIESGTYNFDSSIIEFSVIDIALAIGADTITVVNQLKNLEWITVNGKTEKSEISVKFHTLGFRVLASGDLTNEELQETLELLNHQNQLYTMMCIQQLRFISTTMRNFSFDSINECFRPNQNTHLKSEELKKTICNYFEFEEPISSISNSIETNFKNKADIVADIRNLILSYKDIHFTGRSIARIFHGIQSPNYSALIWSKCPFWRAHLNSDFDVICELAAKEILKMKDM